MTKESLAAEVTAIRAQITDLREELEAVNEAPQTLEEAKAAADRYVDKLAAEFDLPGKVNWFFSADYSGRALLEHERLIYPTDGGMSTVVIDPAPVLAGLFPDLMKKRFHQILTERAKAHGHGLSFQARREQKKALEQQLFDLEIREERLVCQAEELGWDGLHRRADVNPAAVLGIFETTEESAHV